MVPADEWSSRLEPTMNSNARSATARSEFRFSKPLPESACPARSAYPNRSSGWVLASVIWVLAACGGELSGQEELGPGESENPRGALCERSLCDADYDACVSRDEYADCIGDCDCYTLDSFYRNQCQLLCDDKCSSREPDEAKCLSHRAACRRTARDSECASRGVGGASGLGTGGTGGVAAPWPDTREEVLEVCDFSLKCLEPDYGYITKSELRREGDVCVLFVPNTTQSLLADGKAGHWLYSEWHLTDIGLSVCRENPSGWCQFQCGQEATPPKHRCTGKTSKCGSLSVDACPVVAGCAVVGGVCEGGAWPCLGYENATQCETAGCDWNEQ